MLEQTKYSIKTLVRNLKSLADQPEDSVYSFKKNVDVFANIQNVGDSKYRTAYGSGSYYINGGRLASAGVTFRY